MKIALQTLRKSIFTHITLTQQQQLVAVKAVALFAIFGRLKNVLAAKPVEKEAAEEAVTVLSRRVFNNTMDYRRVDLSIKKKKLMKK
jgi:hypothetical protein